MKSLYYMFHMLRINVHEIWLSTVTDAIDSLFDFEVFLGLKVQTEIFFLP